VRFAVAAQLGAVNAWSPPVSQAKIAQASYIDAAVMVRRLNGESAFTHAELRQLDDAFGAIGLEGAGGLSALGTRLQGRGDTWANLDAHIPPGWAEEMLAEPSTKELGVMLQATALVAKLRAAHRAGRHWALWPATPST
jgi:hypothetical protein